MISSKLFITGCDSSTRWMLPWFEANFKKHNPKAHLHVFNFDNEFTENERWFKKPAAMVAASYMAEYVCWIDTDIDVRCNIEDIFDYVEPNKLAMVEDQPWTTRRGEVWHNSGVVAFKNKPSILAEWSKSVGKVDQSANPMVGDQDVLHVLVKDDLKRRIYITDIPKQYNTLRLDVIDGTCPKNIKMMHWTGQKGNDEIRSLMK